MLQYLLRPAKRFAVLVPGVVIVYFSVKDIFPYFDQKLPLSLALFVTYVLGAYLLAPAIIRVVRVIRPAKHLPLYCVTPDGFASDPLNIGIIGTRRQLITVMEQAGWHQSDPHTLRNMARVLLGVALDWTYRNAPVSSLYLFGRKQDIAFQLPVPGGNGKRHHVRFWATTYDATHDVPQSIHNIHWQHRKAHVPGDDSLLWVGAASLDVGFGFIRHNLQVTHMIDPDTNKERELILRQLRAEKVIKKVETIRLEKPYRLINRVMNGALHTDGQMTIASLKPKKI